MESSTSTTFVIWGEHGYEMTFVSVERLRSLVAQYDGLHTREMTEQYLEIHDIEVETIDVARSLIAQYDGLHTRQMSEQSLEIHENEDEPIDQCDDDIDPPGYEEADSFPTVSAWDDYRIDKTGNLIRQYSIRLVRMVSSGSASAAEDPEAENTLPGHNDQPNMPNFRFLGYV